MGLEPTTSSLPRKCSTAELLRLLPQLVIFNADYPPYSFLSGRRGSNSRPIAWKAIALPTELLSLLYSGGRRIRTFEVLRQQSYSLSHLATLVSPHTFKPPHYTCGLKRASYRDRTNDLLITSQLLYQLS